MTSTADGLSEFDAAMALTDLEDGAYAGVLGAGWAIGGAVNGGVLMALAATALRRTLAGAAQSGAAQSGAYGADAAGSDAAGSGAATLDPLAVSGYYLSASVAGPVTAHTETVRVGRTLSTGQASLVQEVDGAPVERLRLLASFGDLSAQGEPVLRSRPAPDMPPPEQCVGPDAAPPGFPDTVAVLGRMDMRLDPATAGWVVGRPSQQGRMRGWLRFADGRPVDAMSLLFFLDALPPVAFDLGIQGWAPTLELSTHVRAQPVDGWLRVELSTQTVTGSLMEEDAAIWDASGRLVAQSRQLAGIRVPPDRLPGGSAGA